MNLTFEVTEGRKKASRFGRGLFVCVCLLVV